MLSRSVNRVSAVAKSPEELLLLQSQKERIFGIFIVTGIVSRMEGYVENSFVDIDKLQGSLKRTVSCAVVH